MNIQIIQDYFRERKELLYFLGGLGLGGLLGKNLLWIGVLIIIGILRSGELYLIPAED